MLTGKQRRFLRALGTGIDPVIQIGKGGIGDTLVQQLDEALEARELVKIRVINNAPLEPREIAEQLAEATNSELVQVIGRNLLYYRRSLKKPSIELPS
ncbi:MAG: ribosome assembly RNA-binding protein YhbY [Bacillota bacterium]|jgi:RNA-binding protein|uniref:Ribosome assembly RNA-binding protein YhbY n=1 Tax=Thermanaerosceptrum fracticalcis TaxID=1712410 RepID=A0A7G6E291_THEFR|nr:ribosome assembly RNA-binding protein YhbY [Thermanaerosceptrum fracticalcis]MBZ4653176.1 putative RNA-binding protein YhbY family [Peptococcaceae bacterium]QNB46195.1 ribosome assembly RNA-binding protein YhbY [Thermanaerosceptrum fracticalcis]